MYRVARARINLLCGEIKEVLNLIRIRRDPNDMKERPVAVDEYTQRTMVYAKFQTQWQWTRWNLQLKRLIKQS